MEKLYKVIYADPPWQYRDKARAGQRGAEFKYSVMTIDNIAALDVGAIAAPDCALFLWITFPLLPEGLRVVEAWGFEYKTAGFVWAKYTKNKKIHWGMGNWTRSNAEICLLGIRGKPKRISGGVHSLLTDPVRAHSEKPPSARDRIVGLFGDVPRAELFAREKAPGWDVWGLEVENDFEIP